MKRGTIRHPKTDLLIASLGINRPQAIGILTMLWDYAGDYAPERGQVGKFTNQQIAIACEWPIGDADRLIEALLLCRWIDKADGEDRLVIHDWIDHCEEWVLKKLIRAKDAKNKRLDTVSTPSRHRPDTGVLPSDTEPKPIPALPSGAEKRPKKPKTKDQKQGLDSVSRSISTETRPTTNHEPPPSLTPVQIADTARRKAYARFNFACGKLWDKSSEKQTNADRTSTERLFDRVWPKGATPDAATPELDRALALAASAGKARNPMAWLTAMVQNGSKFDTQPCESDVIGKIGGVA